MHRQLSYPMDVLSTVQDKVALPALKFGRYEYWNDRIKKGNYRNWFCSTRWMIESKINSPSLCCLALVGCQAQPNATPWEFRHNSGSCCCSSSKGGSRTIWSNLKQPKWEDTWPYLKLAKSIWWTKMSYTVPLFWLAQVETIRPKWPNPIKLSLQKRLSSFLGWLEAGGTSNHSYNRTLNWFKNELVTLTENFTLTFRI